MKVGIDGVLLGAWTPIENAKRILDIGTGTGLIALMLAQRTDAEITAIDIDSNAVLQATENVKNSSWAERIHVFESALQNFLTDSTERFDLIVSNPPYFVNSLKAPHECRTTARHTDSLTHEELIEYSIELLNPNGRICIILPVAEGTKCIEFAERKGLFCTSKVTVYPKPEVIAKRLLLEFSKIKSLIQENKIVVESEIRHRYSPEFTELVNGFYLKL